MRRPKSKRQRRLDARQQPEQKAPSKGAHLHARARAAGLFILEHKDRYDFLSLRTGQSLLTWNARTRQARLASTGGVRLLPSVDAALDLAVKLASRGRLKARP